MKQFLICGYCVVIEEERKDDFIHSCKCGIKYCRLDNFEEKKHLNSKHHINWLKTLKENKNEKEFLHLLYKDNDENNN